jgi:hypothetical protein
MTEQDVIDEFLGDVMGWCLGVGVVALILTLTLSELWGPLDKLAPWQRGVERVLRVATIMGLGNAALIMSYGIGYAVLESVTE